MEAYFRELSSHVALALEVLSVLMIVLGAIEAVGRLVSAVARRHTSHAVRREAWLSLARWLLVGLEFMLAADIVRTVIAPSWDDIGQLAAIAVIRTFLNFFLERDLEAASREAVADPPGTAETRAIQK